MTLQIGRKRRNRRTGFTPPFWSSCTSLICPKRAGFTLIELVIVAAIILVLVAVASPLFRATFRDLELQDATYNLSKLIKYGQQKAIIEEKKYRLLFDFDRGTYHLRVEEEKEETATEGKSSSGTGSTSASGGDWKRTTGRFGEYFYLPKGVKFKGETDRITFLPSGRCDKITLYVVGQKNKTFEIKTNGRAGYVGVSEVKEE